MTMTRHPAVPTTRPEPAPAPADRAPARRASRLVTFVRGHWLRTIPGRLRAYAAAALVALVVLTVVLTLAIGNARDGVQTIGHDAGPQVVATGTLYFALSDMDAQVADILLIGRERTLGIGYQGSLQRYEQRRAAAGEAAVQAAQLAGTDPKRKKNVQEVLDGLGRYERLVGEAMLLDRQADHAAGQLPPDVVRTYRQATDLMKLELLPKAYNLTLDSGATVRQSYVDERKSVQDGRNWVAVTGTLVLLVLIALQLYLARGFRRTINLALALGTLATIALVAVGAGMLSAQAGHLQRAKEDGFDSVLALSRARAISHSAFADESRYLLDPGRADTYEQLYLDKALQVLYVDPGAGKPVNLETYYAKVEQDLDAYQRDRTKVPFFGFFGDEARGSSSGRESDALGRTFQGYRAVLQNDRKIRELVASGDRAGAIKLRMGRDQGAIRDFDTYDAALKSLSDAHQASFTKAIRDADKGLRGWQVVPLAGAAVIIVLVLAGIRPRLAEFR